MRHALVHATCRRQPTPASILYDWVMLAPLKPLGTLDSPFVRPIIEDRVAAMWALWSICWNNSPRQAMLPAHPIEAALHGGQTSTSGMVQAFAIASLRPIDAAWAAGIVTALWRPRACSRARRQAMYLQLHHAGSLSVHRALRIRAHRAQDLNQARRAVAAPAASAAEICIDSDD